METKKMKLNIRGKEFAVAGNPAFWEGVQRGGWEPDTFEILERYLKRDRSYVDIGAWIGPTVLYGAQLAKDCYAYEPDPVAFETLKNNLLLNLSNVYCQARNEAVSDHEGEIEIGNEGELGNSMTSVLFSKNKIKVPCISLSAVIAHIDPNFIKMDIEGGEAEVLWSAREILSRLRPTLYISLHVPWIKDREDYFKKIMDTVGMYGKIYDGKGNQIALEGIRKLEGFAVIVATDE